MIISMNQTIFLKLYEKLNFRIIAIDINLSYIYVGNFCNEKNHFRFAFITIAKCLR